MGCFQSLPRQSANDVSLERRPFAGDTKPLNMVHQWSSSEPWTESTLHKKQNEFWETSPLFEGRQEIWLALRAVCEAKDLGLAQAVIDSAGITIPSGKLDDGAYDERGTKYVCPPFLWADPLNLIRSGSNEALESNTSKPHQQISQTEISLNNAFLSPTINPFPTHLETLPLTVRLSLPLDVYIKAFPLKYTLAQLNTHLLQLHPKALAGKRIKWIIMGKTHPNEAVVETVLKNKDKPVIQGFIIGSNG